MGFFTLLAFYCSIRYRKIFMKKINAFYVQVFGNYTLNHLINLLGDKIEGRITTTLCIVGSAKPITLYKLEADEMKMLQSSRASETLNFNVYRQTRSGGLVDITKTVKEYIPADSIHGQSNNPTVRKTKAQLKALIKRRKKPLVTV